MSSKYYASSLWLVVLVYSFFLTGFFPLKPGDSETSCDELPPAWTRRVGKLVIMVIDALRLDFVQNTEMSQSEFKISFLSSLLQEGRAKLVVTKASPPTVTLPRLKAIMTGSIPSFVDIIRNFDTDSLVEDSLIRQWRRHQRNITMFGDDTWSKLFPGDFLRQDPTTSFFVSDFTEVDENVTRHLQSELAMPDWDVMILHYLGLDHIGHVEGPRSQLVQPKLEEMSEVIRTVWGKLSSEEFLLPPLLLVLGDHGMADGGGHGGSSPAETRVPLVIITDGLHTGDEEALQVDIVPTLAALTGVPIPKWSLGSVLQSALTGLSEQDLLQIVQHNADHLASIAAASGLESAAARDMMEEAGKMVEEKVEQWRSRKMYTESIRLYQTDMVSQATKYDIYLIVLSIGLLGLMLVTNTVTVRMNSRSARSAASLALMMTVLTSCHCLLCSLVPQSELCSISTSSLGKLLLSGAVIMFSLDSLLTCRLRGFTELLSLLLPTTAQSSFLVAASVLSVLSLLSTSFIEEEHQTSYFLLLSLLCLLSLNINHRSEAVSLAVILTLHRALRTFNQTGDKWSHLPDTSDWLNQSQHQHLKLIALAVSLLVVLLVLLRGDNIGGAALKTLFVGTLFMQKNSQNQTNFAQINYILAGCNVCFSHKPSIQLIFDTFLILVIIIQSTTNIMVVSMLLILIHLVKPFFDKLEGPSYQALAVILLSKASYFYFGNSNSLATIDVGAGYVGMVSYSPAIISVLLAIHTFSGPILVLLFMARYVTVKDLVRVEYFFLLTELLIFSVLSTVMRHHLFVWTVFSPKLLYEGMNLVVISVILNLVHFIS